MCARLHINSPTISGACEACDWSICHFIVCFVAFLPLSCVGSDFEKMLGRLRQGQGHAPNAEGFSDDVALGRPGGALRHEDARGGAAKEAAVAVGEARGAPSEVLERSGSAVAISGDDYRFKLRRHGKRRPSWVIRRTVQPRVRHAGPTTRAQAIRSTRNPANKPTSQRSPVCLILNNQQVSMHFHIGFYLREGVTWYSVSPTYSTVNFRNTTATTANRPKNGKQVFTSPRTLDLRTSQCFWYRVLTGRVISTTLVSDE